MLRYRVILTLFLVFVGYIFATPLRLLNLSIITQYADQEVVFLMSVAWISNVLVGVVSILLLIHRDQPKVKSYLVSEKLNFVLVCIVTLATAVLTYALSIKAILTKSDDMFFWAVGSAVSNFVQSAFLVVVAYNLRLWRGGR